MGTLTSRHLNLAGRLPKPRYVDAVEINKVSKLGRKQFPAPVWIYFKSYFMMIVYFIEDNFWSTSTYVFLIISALFVSPCQEHTIL